MKGCKTAGVFAVCVMLLLLPSVLAVSETAFDLERTVDNNEANIRNLFNDMANMKIDTAGRIAALETRMEIMHERVITISERVWALVICMIAQLLYIVWQLFHNLASHKSDGKKQ